MENNVNSEIFENNGNVNISDEVIATIASLAATEVKGVCGMVSSSIGFAELLGKKNLSKGVKITREENNISQKQLAEYLNIKQNTYSQYENGQRQIPIECLITLAKFYKTSTDYILGLTDNPIPYKRK